MRLAGKDVYTIYEYGFSPQKIWGNSWLFSLPKKTAEKKDDRGVDLNPAVNTRQRGTENSREVSQFCEVSKEKNTRYNIEKSTSQELRKGEGTNVDLQDPQPLSLDLSHPYLD